MRLISGSMLYDAIQCPHRISMDTFEDKSFRDDPSSFLEMLWEEGWAHEDEVIARYGPNVLNLSSYEPAEKEARTLVAIQARTPLIYGGRLRHEDLVGEPDLLRLSGAGYIAGDIKSGSGYDGDQGDGKLKKSYALQVAHYTNILEQLGTSDGSREAFIIDRGIQDVPYLLSSPQGVRNKTTWWEVYLATLELIRGLLDRSLTTRGALSATCNLCHWQTRCNQVLHEIDDLTLITDLGRAKRDAMLAEVPTVTALASCDLSPYLRGAKTVFAGIGPDSLVKYQERARLLTAVDGRPYFRERVDLPLAEREVFFDVEADPLRGICYMHGFVERVRSDHSESYIAFVAEEPSAEAEEKAFHDTWQYLAALPDEASVYYYSKYERTAFRNLAERYPAVCSTAEVEALFAQPRMIDLLYDVVYKTEWPTNNRSIKTLARYLGFQWRDLNPSGAASIEWYHQWSESRDPTVLQRILDYNEDDCRAMVVLLDGLRRI